MDFPKKADPVNRVRFFVFPREPGQGTPKIPLLDFFVAK